MKRHDSRSDRQTTEFDRARREARKVLSRTKLRPQVAVVLGSGLGGFADRLSDAVRIPYARIRGFPRPTAEGHAGRLVIGTLNGIAIAVMQGRAHLYEGYSAREIAFPIRVLGQLGIRALVLTNAAGGIHPDFRQGAIVLIRDHVNLMGENPLTGENDERFGARFPDMSDAYCEKFRNIARAEAQQLGMVLYEGVYAALRGPSYETPAEIRFLRTIGADVVGMSTAPEAIAARHMNIPLLALSCVANAASELEAQGISHAEVLAAARGVAERLAKLLSAVIPRLATADS